MQNSTLEGRIVSLEMTAEWHDIPKSDPFWTSLANARKEYGFNNFTAATFNYERAKQRLNEWNQNIGKIEMEKQKWCH